MGQTETVWPAAKEILEPGKPFQCSDKQATALAEKWGGQGVVKLGAGEDVPTAKARGIKQRYEHFVRNVQAFRDLNAQMAAQQKPLILPQAHHRAMLKEIKELQGLVAQDEVLTAPLPTVKPIDNPILKELESFGIPAEVGAIGLGGLTDIDQV